MKTDSSVGEGKNIKTRIEHIITIICATSKQLHGLTPEQQQSFKNDSIQLHQNRYRLVDIRNQPILADCRCVSINKLQKHQVFECLLGPYLFIFLIHLRHSYKNLFVYQVIIKWDRIFSYNFNLGLFVLSFNGPCTHVLLLQLCRRTNILVELTVFYSL